MKRSKSLERNKLSILRSPRGLAVLAFVLLLPVVALAAAGIAAVGCVALVELAGLVLVRRRGRSLAPATAPAASPAPERRAAMDDDDVAAAIADRRELVLLVTREVARAERHQQPLAMTVIRVENLDALDADAAARLDAHMAETLGRITRASDYLGRIARGRFGIVLEQCDFAQAQAFGERAALAIGNRPVLDTNGQPIPLQMVISAAQYDTHRHYGAVDFVRAAETTTGVPSMPVRLAVQGNDLRRRLLGDPVDHAERLVADRRAG
jgi:GGDEF domain-containing protein